MYSMPNTEIKLTKEPDIFTLDDDPLKLRGIMSCGHPVLPGSLTSFIFSEVSKGKYNIYCPYVEPLNPLKKCGKKWTYQEIRKMALLTDPERGYLELKLSLNRLSKLDNFIECPTCSNFVIKRNPKINRIKCRHCAILTKTTSDFCAICLKHWLGSGDQYCGNFECQTDPRVDILKHAKVLKVKSANIPSIRSCPKCELLVEAISYPDYCKTVNCNCGFKFCFICLGYCNQSSRVFPCYETYTSESDKQQSVKIACKPKDAQTELVTSDYQTLAANFGKFIDGSN